MNHYLILGKPGGSYLVTDGFYVADLPTLSAVAQHLADCIIARPIETLTYVLNAPTVLLENPWIVPGVCFILGRYTIEIESFHSDHIRARITHLNPDAVPNINPAYIPAATFQIGQYVDTRYDFLSEFLESTAAIPVKQ